MVTASVVVVVEDVVSGIVLFGEEWIFGEGWLFGEEWGPGRRLGVGGTGEVPRGFSMFSF